MSQGFIAYVLRTELYFTTLVTDHLKVFSKEEKSLPDAVQNCQHLLMKTFLVLEGICNQSSMIIPKARD